MLTSPLLKFVSLHVIYALIIRQFCIQYKTRIEEACDYFQNSTPDEIAHGRNSSASPCVVLILISKMAYD